MAQAKNHSDASRHPYADGSYKKMLIDGKWVDAASTASILKAAIPRAGELLATVAEGDAEDINRAVAAARKAFEGAVEASSSRMSASRSGEACRSGRPSFRRAECVFDTLDDGRADQPVPRGTAAGHRHAALLRGLQATAIHGETISELVARRDIFLHAKGARRRCWRDHSLERPARRLGLENRSGALAAGRTVILKPAEEAPLTPLRLGEVMRWKPASYPAWSTSCPAMAKPPKAALASHPGVDKVAFTGSQYTTGQSIARRAASGNLKRVLAPSLAASRPTSCLPTLRYRGREARRRHGGVRQFRKGQDLQRRHASVRRAKSARPVH